jgi:hypothetical protein
MENSDDKIVHMGRSGRFDEAGAPRQPIEDIDVANHMTARGLDGEIIRHALGYLLIQSGGPDQATLDVIAQLLPWAGSPEQAWTWYQTQPLPSSVT